MSSLPRVSVRHYEAGIFVCHTDAWYVMCWDGRDREWRDFEPHHTRWNQGIPALGGEMKTV